MFCNISIVVLLFLAHLVSTRSTSSFLLEEILHCRSKNVDLTPPLYLSHSTHMRTHNRSASPLCPTDMLSGDAHSPLMWKTEYMNVGQHHRLQSTRLLAGTDWKCCSCFPRLLPGIPYEIQGGMNSQIHLMGKTWNSAADAFKTSSSKGDSSLSTFALTEFFNQSLFGSQLAWAWDISVIWWEMRRGNTPSCCHVLLWKVTSG